MLIVREYQSKIIYMLTLEFRCTPVVLGGVLILRTLLNQLATLLEHAKLLVKYFQNGKSYNIQNIVLHLPPKPPRLDRLLELTDNAIKQEISHDLHAPTLVGPPR